MTSDQLGEILREDGWVSAHWCGDVDMANSAEVERHTLMHVENTDEGVVVDLSRVDYIDSAGIRSLVEIWRLLTERQQRLFLVLPERSVLRRGLEIGGITAMIPTYPSAEAARAAR